MKIRLRLTFLFCGLFALLLLGFSLTVYFTEAGQRKSEYYKRLKQLAVTKTHLLLDARVPPAVLQLIYQSSLTTLPQEEVAIYDTAFRLLYHDAMNIDRIKEDQPMFDSILAFKEIHFDVDELQAVGFLYNYQGANYIITAAAKDDYGLQNLQSLRTRLSVGFVIAILLTLVAGIYFARRALKPVSDMVEKADRISASQLHLRLDSGKGNDEINELALTFNKMLDRLERSFEAQKQFVSNISHELRTPLSVMIAELEVSNIKERSIAEYQQVNALVLQEAKSLSRLSNDLLDFAKAGYDPSGIAFRELRLDEVLLDARKDVLKNNPGYKIDITFETEIGDEDLISIKGNEYLLKVAFSNLMDNGCKFSASHSCSVQISFKDQHPVLRFSDNGIGIPQEDLASIFNPFFRGNNRHYAPGNGIGLSLTARIIQLHQGEITVSANKPSGVVFSISLPYSRN